MSKATKRKYVTKEVLDDFVLPEGDRQVVKVLASRGNNLHEVETEHRDTFLVSMPTKYRKNVWIKRVMEATEEENYEFDQQLEEEIAKFYSLTQNTNDDCGDFMTGDGKGHGNMIVMTTNCCDFLLVQPIEEGDKVKAEIVHILYKDQIRYIQQEGLWPSAFGSGNQLTEDTIPSDMLPPSDEDSDVEEPDLVMVNPNRRQVVDSDTEEDSDNA